MRTTFRPFLRPITLTYQDRTYTLKSPAGVYLTCWWITYKTDVYAALALAGVFAMLLFL